MKLLNKIGIKWIAYGLELFIVFILEQTPGILPSVFGVRPSPIICVCVCIAVFEGEYAGLFYGMVGGMLLDYASTGVFGFNAFFMTAICYFCGLLVVLLMRNNLSSTMLLGGVTALIMGSLRWFFFQALWSHPSLWYHFYAITLPTALYTILLLPMFFYFNRVIAFKTAVAD